MRVAYRPESVGVAGLTEDALAGTWHEQLARWLAEATDAGLAEPNAMVLATADSAGRASSRTVLCKGLDERGVVFYSNHTSAKGHQLRDTHWASATFPWYPLQRQVHVRGVADRIAPEETRAYWETRPRGSQLGAWASVQSAVVAGRRQLEDALEAVTRRYADTEQVPLPPHWGGTRIRPQTVEFWQGRPDRLHDRLRFGLDPATRTWSVVRLQP
jgi:pyridoxamine 5'-phosphate oxidase